MGWAEVLAGGPGEADHILTQSLEPHRALSRLVHGVSRHWAGIMMGSEDPEWWKSEGMEAEDPNEVHIRGQVQASGWVLALCQAREHESKTQLGPGEHDSVSICVLEKPSVPDKPGRFFPQ